MAPHPRRIQRKGSFVRVCQACLICMVALVVVWTLLLTFVINREYIQPVPMVDCIYGEVTHGIEFNAELERMLRPSKEESMGPVMEQLLSRDMSIYPIASATMQLVETVFTAPVAGAFVWVDPDPVVLTAAEMVQEHFSERPTWRTLLSHCYVSDFPFDQGLVARRTSMTPLRSPGYVPVAYLRKRVQPLAVLGMNVIGCNATVEIWEQFMSLYPYVVENGIVLLTGMDGEQQDLFDCLVRDTLHIPDDWIYRLHIEGFPSLLWWTKNGATRECSDVPLVPLFVKRGSCETRDWTKTLSIHVQQATEALHRQRKASQFTWWRFDAGKPHFVSYGPQADYAPHSFTPARAHPHTKETVPHPFVNPVWPTDCIRPPLPSNASAAARLSSVVKAESVTIVVACVEEALVWLNDLPTHAQVVVYDRLATMPCSDWVKGRAGFDSRLLLPNYGFDPAVFLHYIISDYDHLPPVMCILHGHGPGVWHDQGHNPLHALHRFDFDCIAEKEKAAGGYFLPIRAPLQGSDELDRIPDSYFEERFFDFWQTAFPNEPIPQRLSHFCCGQLCVTRERVWKRSKAVYARILDYLLRETTASYSSGRMLEFTYSHLFGEPPNLNLAAYEAFGYP